MLEKIEKAISGVEMVIMWVCGISISIMVIYSFIDVWGRFLFRQPLYGTYELSGEILLVVVIFLSLAPCEAEKRHMRVDFIFPYISKTLQVVINCISFLLGIVVCGLLMVASFGPALYSWQIREFTTGIIPFPIYTAKIAIVVGLAIFVIRLIERFARSIKELVTTNRTYSKTSGPDISHASDQI
ncbi:MAG: TRAP transporter small permease [bacterium]